MAIDTVTSDDLRQAGAVDEVAPSGAVVSSDELRDVVWVDIFPWLDACESNAAKFLEELVPDVGDWWIADTPRDTWADTSLDDLLAGLSALVVRRHRSTAFRELVQTLSDTIPLAALRLSPRPETVVRRLAHRDIVPELMARSVDDMFTVRGTSLESVEQIVAGLLGAAIRIAPESGLPDDDEQENPAAQQLVDDLRVLARWRRLRGRADDTLISVDADDEAPESVQDAALRIAALTGGDLDGGSESNPIDEIENLVEQLDEREGVVLRDYIMAQTPITLGELSVRLHVTKSRAGALVSKVKQDFVAACDFDTAAGGLMAGMRAEIQPIAPLARLVRMHPILEQTVPSLGVRLWLVLDRLDDAFEVIESWAVSPDKSSALARTASMLEQFESTNGVVPLSVAAQALGLSVVEVTEWFAYGRIPVVNGCALMSTAKLTDHAAGVLEATQRAMTTRMVIDALDCNRSESAVARALDDDERFVGGDDGYWRLGAAHPGEQTSLEAKDFRSTRRLYRVDGQWTYRMHVGADHLRGASLTVPAGVAEAFGLRPGGVLEASSDLGPQILRWTGANPTCGSIRRFLDELSAQADDMVFVHYSVEHGFAITSCATTEDDPIRRALALVGCPAPAEIDGDDVVPMLATAVGLASDAKRRRVLSVYQSRDEMVADLLQSVWVTHDR